MAKAIYLISVLHNIDVIVEFVYGIILGIFFFITISHITDDRIGEYLMMLKKNRLTISLIVVPYLIVAIFIPKQEQMYEMLVLDRVLTKENYTLSVSEMKNLISYTANEIKKIK